MVFEALLPVSWADEMVSDKEAGLDNENVEDVAAEQEDDPAADPVVFPDLSTAEMAVRRRYRRWAERLTEAAGKLGAPERMLVTRLLLWTAAAGAWDRDDRAWVALLSQALQSLGGAEHPPAAEPQVGSLAAVPPSVLRAEAPRYAHTWETIAFENAAGAVAHLLVATDAAYVGEYTRLLGTAFGAAVAPETVEAVASDVVQTTRSKMRCGRWPSSTVTRIGTASGCCTSSARSETRCSSRSRRSALPKTPPWWARGRAPRAASGHCASGSARTCSRSTEAGRGCCGATTGCPAYLARVAWRCSEAWGAPPSSHTARTSIRSKRRLRHSASSV